MRYVAKGVLILAMLGLGADGWAASRPGPAPKDDQDSITIVFKDGHRQSFRLAEIARIDFAPPAALTATGGGHFTGQWKVGIGIGSGTFLITLDPDGQATKTTGSPHGIWTVVDGEAHINWDDGWHDAIRKVGDKYEKVAFGPGSTFSSKPSNVTDAVYTESN